MSVLLTSRNVKVALFPFAMLAGACGKADAGKHTKPMGPDTSIVIPTLPMSSKSEEALLHVNNGMRYVRAEVQYDKAYDEFKRAIAADTGFAYAYYLGATVGVNNQERVSLVQAAVARSGTASVSERLVIQSYEQLFKRNIRGALVLAESLPILNPDNAAGWEILGMRQEDAGAVLESRHSFQRLVELDSNYAFGWFRLGTTYYRAPAADTVMAERYILTGVKLWPNEYASSVYLGILRRAQNRLDDVLAAYSHAIEVAPNRASGYKLRADLYAQTGRFQQARADYDAAIRFGKPDETLEYSTARAFVSAYEGNFDECLKELLEVEQAIRGVRARAPLQQEDNLSFAVFEIAVRQRQFDVAEAAGKRAFETGIRLGRGDDLKEMSDKDLRNRFNFWETEIAIGKGQFDVAMRKLRTMEKAGVYGVGGTNPEYRGLMAQGKNQYALAEREYRKYAPDQLTLYNLAVVVAAQGRSAEARSFLEKLLKRRGGVNWNDASVRYDAEQMLKGLSSADSARKTEVGR